MKKLINRSQYAEELAYIPQVLEPMMKKVRDDLEAQIPKGWVFLRLEEVPADRGRIVTVITTMYVVKAPRIIARKKKSTINLV